MKITKIELFNFGSYEGYSVFDLTSDDPKKRIVIIGGENGSGKTTLFTAIEVCLYGNYAFGYKNAGRLYTKKISKLINSTAYLKHDGNAYITIEFQQTNSREMINYRITRMWTWGNGEIEETLKVMQDGILMSKEDVGSFQEFLIHLIPPDMLNLYFFDGEKISDYFLNDNNTNIREALMILSGNDTFDILHENVHRVLNLNKNSDTSETANQYCQAKEDYERAERELKEVQMNQEKLILNLDNEKSKLTHMKSQYVAHGGVTLEQLNRLQMELKEEEEKRGKINSHRKSIATDILPFVILKEWVEKIEPQIQQEENFEEYTALESKLSNGTFQKTLKSVLKENGVKTEQSVDNVMASIKKTLLYEDWTDFSPLFQLSNDEKAKVRFTIDKVQEYDTDTLKEDQKELDKSLEQSKKIREKIQNSDAEHIEDYIRQTALIEGEIKLLNSKIEQGENDIIRLKESLNGKNKALENSKKAFENSLKKESVSTLSGKLLLLIEDLQNNIYSELIKKVETDLNYKMKQLMRKEHFFDKVSIDKDFNVHIIKNQTVSVNDMIQIVRAGGVESLKEAIGELAVEELFGRSSTLTNDSIIEALDEKNSEEIELPIEIKKENMSSGEKQIFVMSLYWALMRQSDNELPFVIDTPFARIDTEHRENITKYFFMDLKGQLFILSTNEELEQEHLDVMANEIARTYTLEYGEEKRTIIHENTFFGV